MKTIMRTVISPRPKTPKSSASRTTQPVVMTGLPTNAEAAPTTVAQPDSPIRSGYSLGAINVAPVSTTILQPTTAPSQWSHPAEPGDNRWAQEMAKQGYPVIQQPRPGWFQAGVIKPMPTSVQRQPAPQGATLPTNPATGVAEPTRTKPSAVNIGISPSTAIVFHSATATLNGVSVYVTGRMAIRGKASLIGEELPKKKSTEVLRTRVQALVGAAFSAATPTGTATKIEIPLGGESLVLELAEGAERAPAFQVSGHFSTKPRTLAVPGSEITGATLVLDATVWIAPTKPPTAGGSIDAGTPPTPGDASVKRLGFADQEVQFAGEKRTGGVTLKSTMDDFEKQVPDFVKHHAILQLPEQRAAFFQHMRPYFGTDEKTIAHFAKLRQAKVKGATTWLHDEAATRLEAVQAELGLEHMPASGGVGWPRSEATFSSTQGIGNLHTIGFAVDYNAYQTPHLKDRKILDLIQIVTGRSATANYETTPGIDTRQTGETFTSGTAEAKQKLEADPKIQQWLERVGREAEAVSQASEDFRASLKSTDAAGVETDLAPKLQDLRQEWFAAKTENERQLILAQLPTVLKPWLDKVAQQKKAMEDKITAAGLDPAKLPTAKPLDVEVNTAQTLVTQIATLTSRLRATVTKPQRTQMNKLIAAARKLLTEAGEAPASDADAAGELQRLAGLVERRQTALTQKKWLDRVSGLQAALTGNPGFVFGESAAKAVSDPALAQLVDSGFFTLQGKPKAGKEAFNVDFVKSMVKHGFTHGATWSTPDLMHFELRWKGPGQS